MAVYTGQVSHKNGLGRVRTVTATDNMSLAIAFGIEGAIGATYSNGKVGMLQLEGEASHSEVAIDPNEMTRISDLDYAKSHPSMIVDFGALSNAISRDNYTELVSILQRVSPRAEFNTLSDQARGEIVKLLIGVGDVATARSVVKTDSPTQALLDTVKRSVVSVNYSKSSTVGGVDFSIGARGTTSVLIQESRKLINVKIIMKGHVTGSASNAGSAFKQRFVDIKKAVVAVAENDDLDRSVQYDPEEDFDATANNVRTLIAQRSREIVRRAVREIETEFANIENFNPASTKARIWNELNLTTTDVPQTGLDIDALRSYNNDEITAVGFAELPVNGMSAKLLKSVIRRLENADFDAFAERIVDVVAPNVKGSLRNDLINKIYPQVEATVNDIIEKFDTNMSFEEVYDLYTAPNSRWEKEIITKTTEKLSGLDDNDERQHFLDYADELLSLSVKIDVSKAVDNALENYGVDAESAKTLKPKAEQIVFDNLFGGIVNTIHPQIEKLSTQDSVDDYLEDFLKSARYLMTKRLMTDSAVRALETAGYEPNTDNQEERQQIVMAELKRHIEAPVASALNRFVTRHNLIANTSELTEITKTLTDNYALKYYPVVLGVVEDEDFKNFVEMKEIITRTIRDRVARFLLDELNPDIISALKDHGLYNLPTLTEDSKRLADEALFTALSRQFYNIYSDLTEKYGVNFMTGNNGVSNKVATSESDVAHGDFQDYVRENEATPSQYPTLASAYVRDNYDYDFIANAILNESNLDDYKFAELKEIALSVSMSPVNQYDSLSSDEWITILKPLLNDESVTIDDWHNGARGSAQDFVETHVPDWRDEVDNNTL